VHKIRATIKAARRAPIICNPGVHKVTIPVGRNVKDMVRNIQQHLGVT